MECATRSSSLPTKPCLNGCVRVERPNIKDYGVPVCKLCALLRCRRHSGSIVSEGLQPCLFYVISRGNTRDPMNVEPRSTPPPRNSSRPRSYIRNQPCNHRTVGSAPSWLAHLNSAVPSIGSNGTFFHLQPPAINHLPLHCQKMDGNDTGDYYDHWLGDSTVCRSNSLCAYPFVSQKPTHIALLGEGLTPRLDVLLGEHQDLCLSGCQLLYALTFLAYCAAITAAKSSA